MGFTGLNPLIYEKLLLAFLTEDEALLDAVNSPPPEEGRFVNNSYSPILTFDNEAEILPAFISYGIIINEIFKEWDLILNCCLLHQVIGYAWAHQRIRIYPHFTTKKTKDLKANKKQNCLLLLKLFLWNNR